MIQTLYEVGHGRVALLDIQDLASLDEQELRSEDPSKIGRLFGSEVFAKHPLS